MKRRKLIFSGVGLISTIAYGKQDKRQISQFFEQLQNEIPLANAAQAISSFQYLKLKSAPKFRKGHTLPPLSRFGWGLPLATKVELAKNWGYALEWGGESEVMALAVSEPSRYKLAVVLNRSLPKITEAIWLHNNQGRLVSGKKIWSPEAPVTALRAAANLRTEALRQIKKKAPISVVLNGGEYGLGVPAAVSHFCQQDPVVMSAKGNRSWFDYISERKAYQESFITKAVREISPDLYVHYPTDSSPHRNRYEGWQNYCYDYKYMRSISDYPSSSTYFKEFNTGWTGAQDILTGVLNSVGQQIKSGDPLSYNWVCSGWLRGIRRQALFGEIARYTGFLKCYYTAGMIGGIAGYFDYPQAGFNSVFDIDHPPNWLQQIIALSHVHALFSHLEEYIRNGDLLKGPVYHRWSKDTPAYEFPNKDPDVRILARKHRRKSDWLITAWAASGNQREITVKIPVVGRVSILARPIGSIYKVKIVSGEAKLAWVDQ